MKTRFCPSTKLNYIGKKTVRRMFFFKVQCEIEMLKRRDGALTCDNMAFLCNNCVVSLHFTSYFVKV